MPFILRRILGMACSRLGRVGPNSAARAAFKLLVIFTAQPSKKYAESTGKGCKKGEECSRSARYKYGVSRFSDAYSPLVLSPQLWIRAGWVGLRAGFLWMIHKGGKPTTKAVYWVVRFSQQQQHAGSTASLSASPTRHPEGATPAESSGIAAGFFIHLRT